MLKQLTNLFMRFNLLHQLLFKFLLLIVVAQGTVIAQPTLQWERTITSASKGYTYMYDFMQTPDGGYIMAGQSDADAGGDKSQNRRGITDYWVVKLRPDLTKEWDGTYGGTGSDILYTVIPTPDGGYLLGGESNSDKGFEKSEDCLNSPDNDGDTPSDYWIVKISANGVKLWDKTFSNQNGYYLKTVKATPDGGFILIGPVVGGNNVLKINSQGNTEWEKTYPKQSVPTLAETIITTSDNGYIIVGAYNTVLKFGTGVSRRGTWDYWILKIDASGAVQWEKSYGGPDYDHATGVTQVADGGYIITGTSESPAGGNKSEGRRGKTDAWIIKLKSDGSLVWEKTLGGGEFSTQNQDYIGDNSLKFLDEDPNGSIVLAGYSNGKANGDKTSNTAGGWIVNLDQEGGRVSDTTLPYVVGKFTKTLDGGFLTAGYPDAFRIRKYAYPKPAQPSTIRINAGGAAFTTATKKTFSADQYYAGIDRTSSIPSGDILNTTNDVLYRSARCSPTFSYNIPVVNGKVDVVLHFSETYYGAPGKKGGAGSRQFHVNIEGSRKLTNFDIFTAVGGALKAYQRTFSVTITDGVLNIDFLSGAADLPRISAIEVVPVTNFTLQPMADAYVQDGTYNKANFGATDFLDVKKSSSNLSTNRSAYLKFQLPTTTGITSAKLRVYGHNHENTNSISLHAYGVNYDSWIETTINKVNEPAASTTSLGYVGVNNVYKYYEIDVTSYVKAQQQSGDQIVSLLLNDPNNRNTRLVFNSKENDANSPQLVIQTAPVTVSNTREGVEEVMAETEAIEVNIFPNPASEVLNIELADWANVKSVEIFNSQSNLVYNSGPKSNIDIQNLISGIYIVKISMCDGSSVTRRLVVTQ